MTSCAPRLQRQSGPTWDSVAIHWTDSDMNRLEPVDGLPWIRTSDKAKLFNKNGPLRVVGKYRNTDGLRADKDSDYRHVSLIADAIEQPVLVEIRLPNDVPEKPGPGWPRFRMWAFLQPPTIGADKERNKANGGYVVDDIPRAGWFEAVVDGATMTAEMIDYSRGHKSPAGRKSLKVTGERDATRPNVVRFKLVARVSNNESEIELKEKAKTLRKKSQDVSLMEAGSYLKVWVRNEERSWSVKPLDDGSEKIVQSMAESDLIKAGASAGPRKFRNHTWKRSRLATHKSILSSVKNRDNALLYVGLYPAHVIEKIETFEAKIAKTGQHESHPLAWLLTVIAWTLLAQGAKALRTKVASRKDGKGAVGDESPYVKTTQQIAELFESAQLSELFASYAVAGYAGFTDVMGKVEAAQVHHAKWYSSTRTLMETILKASLLSDARSRDHHALQRLLEKIDKERSPPKKKTFKDSIAKNMLGWGRKWRENSFTATVGLLDFKQFTDKDGKQSAVKTIPAVPSPLPLPFLQWLSWYMKLQAEAGLNLTFAIACSREGELELTAGIEGKGTGSVKVGLQGIWARVGDAASETLGRELPGPEGELLKKIVELVNLELSLKAEISPEASAKIRAKFSEAGSREDSWDVKFDANFGCPLEFNLSLFSWSYNTFNGKVWDLTKSQGSFFKDVIAFGRSRPEWKLDFEWGESNYDRMCYTLPDKKDRRLVANFGAIIPVHLGYSQAVNPEKCTASLAIVTDTALELADSIPVEHHSPATQGSRGMVVAPLRLTWNPSVVMGPGVISLHAMYKARWDKLQKALHAVSKGERAIRAIITTPENEKLQLSKLSSATILQPKARRAGERTMTQPRAGLIFQFDMDFYSDSHIWVKLCEDDLLYDDTCGLRGEGKGHWRLYPLLGTPDLHSKRQVFIPGGDIAEFGSAESTYQFYTRLALLDDDSCEIPVEGSARLTVPASTLATMRRG